MTNSGKSISDAMANDIHFMLWGLGDSETPLLSTAKKIENILILFITALIKKAARNPKKSCKDDIRLEDVLYALKDDKSKLARLIDFIDVKDLLMTNFNYTKVSKGLSNTYSAPRKSHSVSKLKAIKILKRYGVKDIHSYSSNDRITMERKVRADRISRTLDAESYIKYSESRQFSFICNQSKRKQFLEWLKKDKDNAQKTFKVNAVDLIAYSAKDAIAELVDMALFSRKKTSTINPNELTECNFSVDLYERFKILNSSSDKLQENISPLTPDEIQLVSHRIHPSIFD